MPSPTASSSSSLASSATPLTRSFALEAGTGMATVVFGASQVVAPGNDALRRVLAAYVFVWGAFVVALALRRRSPAPAAAANADVGKSGIAKAIDKLAEAKPFGFKCLAVSPLIAAYGGLTSFVAFAGMYLTAVQAMRVSDAELAAMVKLPVAPATPASSTTSSSS